MLEGHEELELLERVEDTLAHLLSAPNSASARESGLRLLQELRSKRNAGLNGKGTTVLRLPRLSPADDQNHKKPFKLLKDNV